MEFYHARIPTLVMHGHRRSRACKSGASRYRSPIRGFLVWGIASSPSVYDVVHSTDPPVKLPELTTTYAASRQCRCSLTAQKIGSMDIAVTYNSVLDDIKILRPTVTAICRPFQHRCG